MFVKSLNNIICMNRGDTWSTSIPINIGSTADPEYYNLTANDYVYFGVMEPEKSFEHSIVCKKLDINNVTKENYVDITFDSIDTEYLQPGIYYYEVKLLRPNDVVDTIIPKTKFIVVD